MKDIFEFFEKTQNTLHFVAIRIQLASPNKIREWSSGEIKKPETINYRTFKPEKDGLFCSRIFGPIKDYECLCGKYKKMKHRGVVCEKCGVEVIQAKVRRKRKGHILLASPVAHIWFLKSLPSRIGALLGMMQKDLEKVLYCDAYVVVDAGGTNFTVGEILTEDQYQRALDLYGDDSLLAGMGGESVRELLRHLESGVNGDGRGIEQLSAVLRISVKNATSEIKTKKLGKRLKIVESFKGSTNKLEWMILEVIPVISPDLRPLVPLDNGRLASSDLNDLYRRIVNRSNRLNKLQELNAPEIIIRNEKRMLQESVDTLFDNGKKANQAGINKNELKSLSEMLKGKYGRFRQNLLGKRVDYSGRSVIIVGPTLLLHQCGLPKRMALELFKPFIYNKLEERGYVTTIKSAKKLVDEGTSEVWDVLDEVIKGHLIMLNRAPTLHRLGIQAFEPQLIDGKAIQLHPLVCTAFNADFDGDQMAVHVPLSIEAQIEARVLMLSSNNILSTASGKPIINPTQDIVLGCYYMTSYRPYVLGENMCFSNVHEVRTAYDSGEVSIHALINCRINSVLEKTTVGRVLLYEIIPKDINFTEINKVMTKQELSSLIEKSHRTIGPNKTIILADDLRALGYKEATKAGISIAIHNMKIPKEKKEIVLKCHQEVEVITNQYLEGFITDGERYNKVVDIWSKAANEIADIMINFISTDEIISIDGEKIDSPSFNSLYIMSNSGARSSNQQLRQLAGMRGLMAKPSGEIIETPITANFREGLTALQYFTSTHGARKGLADTALKTANSGYLTRRLVDVAQDSIITEFDCKGTDSLELTALIEGNDIVETIGERALGRIIYEDIINPINNEILLKAGLEVEEKYIKKINTVGVSRIKIRSVLTCKTENGICVKCYGRDLSKGFIVSIGEAVGVIAGQSIGEPGTQLTMRTFHIGGIASGPSIETSYTTKGHGVVDFENLKVVERKDGKYVAINRQGSINIIENNIIRESYPIVYGATIHVGNGENIKAGTTLLEWDPYSIPIMTEVKGVVKFKDLIEGVTVREQVDETTGLSHKVILDTKSKKIRPRIDIRTVGFNRKMIEEIKKQESYILPSGSTIVVNEGEKVYPGDVLVKMNREATKVKDITGGLPRVVELFEARRPKDYAIISEIKGTVKFGKIIKGKIVININLEDGDMYKYQISKSKYIRVNEGDYVRAGEPLMDGPINPHDILRILGEKKLAKYLVEEIQDVYRLQGVKINDKHIEVIVKQMLKRVKIKDPGDTKFLFEENIEKIDLKLENERIKYFGGKIAMTDPLLLGITKASLSTKSFISAASFQETTKVLTEAAISSKVDHIQGLKENVIIGRLVPVGTGYPKHQFFETKVEKEEEKDIKENTPLELLE